MTLIKRAIFVLSILALGARLSKSYITRSPINRIPIKVSSHAFEQDVVAVSRRDAFNIFGTTLVGTALAPELANASGGATAGGAYLLSAKQRYNKRVTAGISALLALESSLDAGSMGASQVYFTSEGEGTWEDLSAAGYLLSNAFRRNSTAAPDSLPSVKKWKAFAADITVLEKIAKKGKDKDCASALAALKKAEASLDAYLDAVELPSVDEMK